MRNGSALAPPWICCRIGVSTSRDNRGSPTLERIAATTFARATSRSRAAGSIARSRVALAHLGLRIGQSPPLVRAAGAGACRAWPILRQYRDRPGARAHSPFNANRVAEIDVSRANANRPSPAGPLNPTALRTGLGPAPTSRADRRTPRRRSRAARPPSGHGDDCSWRLRQRLCSRVRRRIAGSAGGWASTPSVAQPLQFAHAHPHLFRAVGRWWAGRSLGKLGNEGVEVDPGGIARRPATLAALGGEQEDPSVTIAAVPTREWPASENAR